jgi:glucokinase
MTAPAYTIGLDIGGTSLKSVCVTHAGEVFRREMVALAPDDSHWPELARCRVNQMEKEFGAAGSIGVGAPGIARPDGTAIAWMQGRLAELEGLNWAKLLGRESVPVLNDAQAALLGEAWQGAAAGCTNVILLTLGTGVGGAAIVDGRLLKGHIGRAGHLGHISLDPNGPLDIVNTPGSLENAIGNCTISIRTGGRFDSTLALAAAYQAGEKDAVVSWLHSVRALAAGIASLINALDPEIVVIGGGISTAGKALFEPLSVELNQFEWRPHGHRVRIEPARLGEYAGALGAARNAMDVG